MSKVLRYLRQLSHIPLSMLMLAVLVFFTFIFFTYFPYIGFYFHPDTGEILSIHNSNSALQLEDTLLQVGDVSHAEFKKNLTLPFFTNEMNNQIVPIVVDRNGTEVTIQYQVPGFSMAEFRGRLFNIWWLAYIFWLFGAAVEAFVRPHKTQWLLLMLANHLAALWVLLGSFSTWHLFGISVLFHAFTWLVITVALHLQWVFPKPIRSLPKIFYISMYIVSSILFFAEIVQAVPRSTYLIALLIALIGIGCLQAVRFLVLPKQRKEIRFLLVITLIGMLPILYVIILSSLSGEISPYLPIALLPLLIIPISYLYLIFREQLGGLEIRINLYISIFAFLILFGTILMLLINLTALLPAQLSALLNFVIPLISIILSSQYYPNFKKYIEKKIIGIKLDNETLHQEYIKRIISCTSLDDLLKLLEDETFPSLLIRQYVFLQNTNGITKTLLAKNVSANEMMDEIATNHLLERSGFFIPKFSSDNWMRLILPLQVGDSTLGFFLLGQRDPDDFYHQTEISILQTIANQTAVALSNILYAEQLKQIYQVGIERYEAERNRLGRDLHDRVLNMLGDLHKKLGDEISATVQNSYQQVAQRLREIISDLRPTMLLYGFVPAVYALAENLMQKTDDQIKVIVDLHSADQRLPENVESHLFWIVNEACENTLRHANASIIKVYGSISSHAAQLFIEDDGRGFDMSGIWNLNHIIASQHFGLAGMLERAEVIGATLNIEAKPHTKVTVQWDSKK